MAENASESKMEDKENDANEFNTEKVAVRKEDKQTPHTKRNKKRKFGVFNKPEEAVDFVSNLVEKTKKYTDFLQTRMGKILESTKGEQPKLFCGKLRGFQVEGYNWLKSVYENGTNAILGDEMGLGKTAQSIALIAHLVGEGVNGPFLVCAPLSTLQNWIEEFERFAPEVKTLYYHGTKEERKEMWKDVARHAFNSKVLSPVVVTSYNIAMNDQSALKRVDFKYIVIDEAQRIKNAQCLLFKTFRQLSNKGSVPNVLLTGTPLQNNLAELWSLLNYVLPEVFSDFKSFESLIDITELNLDDIQESLLLEQKKDKIVEGIHQVLTPFFLRRTKVDVEGQEGEFLPPKRAKEVHIPMTSLQISLYTSTEKYLQQKHVEHTPTTELKKRKKTAVNYNEDYVWDSLFSDVDLGSDIASTFMFATKESVPPKLRQSKSFLRWQLRKICQHPYLVQDFLNPRKEEGTEDIVTCCGKLTVLDALLNKLKEDGHKVLIFTQLHGVLNVLEEYCDLRNFSYQRLDGDMHLDQRTKNMNSFKNDKNMFIFLISTRAGGLGLNLVAADTVIIYDSDYNPQCDLQAQDRCHRIGQTKLVLVLRLVARGCIDTEIVEVASKKRCLERLIIPNDRYNTSDTLTKVQKPVCQDDFIQCWNSDGKRVYELSGVELSNTQINEILNRSD